MKVISSNYARLWS